MQNVLKTMVRGCLIVLCTMTFGKAYAGGGSKVDTIKVTKCYYAAANHTILLAATSSAGGVVSAVGFGQIFVGGKYGGSVFFSPTQYPMIHFISTTGGDLLMQTTPFQF